MFNLTYNQPDRLAAVQQGATSVAGYGYDAFGQRLTKSLPGSPATTILYQYDLAGRQIEDSDISSGAPAVQADYVYLGGQPIGLVLGAALYCYHTDRLGTPQAVTDGAAAVQWAGNYEPFGRASTSGSIAQNLRLPGQYADAETGWYHNGFRTYAPDLGRYIQADPIGLSVGTDIYVYAGSNPLSYIDPSGLARKLDPNSDECRTLAQKIDSIRDDLAKPRREYETNPLRLPETAPPGSPRRASRSGHLELIQDAEENLKRREREYKEKCGCNPGIRLTATCARPIAASRSS